MLIRHASVNLPTEQDIKATFESFQKANPSLNASKISEAKDEAKLELHESPFHLGS